MPRTLSATLLVVACAAAEESSTIIVTAERGESDLARAPVSVEVVDAAAIRERGYALNQTDWLREQPGISVIGTSGGIDGGTTRISLRGVDPSFNAVLLDGIPLYDGSGTDGIVNPSVVDPAGTGRVEVLKGAQSGLYGSGAVGGVVNILSARPTAEAQAAARITAGSFGTGQLEAAASGPLGGKFGYAAGVSILSSRGFSSTTGMTDNGNPDGYEADALRRRSVIARLEWRPLEELTVFVGGLEMRNRQEYDTSSFTPPYAPMPDDGVSNWRTEVGRWSTGATWHHDGLTIEGDAAETRVERISHDANATADTTYSFTERWFSLRVRQQLPAGFRAGAGVDARRDAGSQTEDGQPAAWDERTAMTGGYVQCGWGGRHAEVDASARSDHHQDFGDHTSGRLAAAVFSEDLVWKLRAAAGTGFVAPTLYQLHGAFPAYLYTGNPDLKPQTARQYEVGTDVRPSDHVEASLTVFRTDYDRQIIYYSDPMTFASTYVNGDSGAWVKGVEGSVRLSDIGGSGIDLSAWGTHLASFDGRDDVAYYTPQNSGGVRLTAHQEQAACAWWESIGAEAESGYRSYPVAVSSYTVANAAIGVLVQQRWEVAMRVDNLLDRHYETTPGYTTQPRSAFLSLRAKF